MITLYFMYYYVKFRYFNYEFNLSINYTRE